MMKEIAVESTWSIEAMASNLDSFEKVCKDERVNFVIRPITVARMLPEIAVSVIGGVSVYLITKLIETIIQKFKPGPSLSVYIVHKDVNVTFNIPEDREKCLAHFEEYSRDRIPAISMSSDDTDEVLQLERIVLASNNVQVQKGTLRMLTDMALDNSLAASKSLIKILLIEGTNSDADLKIGRDLWKRTSELPLFLGFMAHEIGHNILSEGLGFPYR